MLISKNRNVKWEKFEINLTRFTLNTKMNIDAFERRRSIYSFYYKSRPFPLKCDCNILGLQCTASHWCNKNKNCVVMHALVCTFRAENCFWELNTCFVSIQHWRWYYFSSWFWCDCCHYNTFSFSYVYLLLQSLFIIFFSYCRNVNATIVIRSALHYEATCSRAVWRTFSDFILFCFVSGLLWNCIVCVLLFLNSFVYFRYLYQ